jgi:hypothetical protein
VSQNRSARYIGEQFVAGSPQQAAADARRAAAELTAEGRAIHLLRTIAVPADELCLHVFAADSAELVDEAGRRAKTPFDRVVAATELVSPDPERRPQ